MRTRSDGGQLVPLYAVVLLVACGTIVLLGQLGHLANRRARARTAADAAALAGAAEGRAAAEAMAAANGAIVEGYGSDGAEVNVVVRIGGTHATARAQRVGACNQLAEPQHLHFPPCQPSNRG